MFFDILFRYPVKDVLINDINIELMNTYYQLQHHVDNLIPYLQAIQNDFWQMDAAQQKVCYYENRKRFNNLKNNGNESANLEKAALFLFLNKTCFNGLFRVNKQGLFNVPMGSYKKPTICDVPNLEAVSKLLQNVKIQCGDYKECLHFIDSNTFVYIDPPYRPLTESSSFTAYAETPFGDSEQRLLGHFVDGIHKTGAKLLISNSDPRNADEKDTFFDDLYQKYDIERVFAKRMINCNSKSRGAISELLINNYGGEQPVKLIEKYSELGFHSKNEAFGYLLSGLKDTIRTYDFFVAWEKVLGNVAKIEIALNIMNSLIGKENIAHELKGLIRSYPEIVPAIPLLIAVRESSIKIAALGGDIKYSFLRNNFYSEDEIESIVCFAKKCGLLKILSDKSVKNLVDYCIGVEVGLDTNARKNRSGTAMENLTEVYIKAICEKNAYQYLAQATAAKIKAEFGKDVPTDKADRHFDFAIQAGDKVYLLEVNYYSGGGSKLKSVAGEFKSLFSLVTQNPSVGFVWVTDGQGWLTAERPLLETFDAIDYVLNLNMIQSGLLEEIVTKGL